MCFIGTIQYGLQVVFCFRHFTVCHYHLNQECSQALKICKCLWSLSCGCVVNMLLVLSISFHFHYYIWGCMFSTGPLQFRWLKGYIQSSCYYHHQIGNIKLTQYHNFPWLCAGDVFTSYSVIYCIYIPGKPEICFHYYCAVCYECK